MQVAEYKIKDGKKHFVSITNAVFDEKKQVYCNFYNSTFTLPKVFPDENQNLILDNEGTQNEAWILQDKIIEGTFWKKENGEMAENILCRDIPLYTDIAPLKFYNDGTTQFFNETLQAWEYKNKGDKLLEFELQEKLNELTRQNQEYQNGSLISDGGFVSMNYNYIKNGNFSSRQKGNSVTHTGTGNEMSCADLWYIRRGDGLRNDIITARQFTNNKSLFKVQRIAATTSTSLLACGQLYDSEDVAEGFAGKTKAFSFEALHGTNYSGINGITCKIFGSITNNDQTGKIGLGFNTNVEIASFTVPSILTGISNIKRYNFIASIPSNIQSMMICFQYTPVGTANIDDSFFIANVKSEISTIATPFLYLPQPLVFDSVLPYFERIKAATAGASVRTANTFADGTTTARATLFYLKTKKKTPNVTPSGVNILNLLRNGPDQISTNIASASIDTNTARIDVTSSGLTGGESIILGLINTTVFIDIYADNLILSL